MAKEFASFFASPLGERIRSPLGVFGAPCAYLLMGHSTTTGGATRLHSQVDRYEDDTWAVKPDHPNNLWAHVAWSFLGRVHVCAGHKGGGPGGFSRDHTRYENETQTWVSMPEIPAPARTDAIALQVGGRVHVCSGQQLDEINEDEGLLVTHEAWNEADRTWVALPALPAPKRESSAGFVIAGRAIVVGGHTKDFGLGNHTGDTTEYDPLTKTWTQLAELPRTGTYDNKEESPDWPEDMASATAYAGTRGYVFMGNAPVSHDANWARAYNRADNVWVESVYVPEIVPGRSDEDELPVNMPTPSAVVMAGVIHLMGGGAERSFPEQDDLERYNLYFNARDGVWAARRGIPEPARDYINVVAP